MGKLRPKEGGPGPGSDMSWGRAAVSPPVEGLPFFPRALRGVDVSCSKEIPAEYGGKGWPLTKSLIGRQKIGSVVIHVLNGDGEAS